MFGNWSVELCSALTNDLFAVWLGVYALFLPLFVFVLYVGYRRCSSQPSSSTNHSDVFALNVTAMEIVNMSGAFLFCVGNYAGNMDLYAVGVDVIYVASVGQMYFHDLTCVERYLAVVYPITYMRLKKRGGVKVRNVSIVCGWGLCFLIATLKRFSGLLVHFYLISVPSILSILVVCFCTASVLRVLIRPRPGEVGGDRKGLDQSKRAAFHTMLVSLGALISRFLILLLTYSLFFIPTLDFQTKCSVSLSSYWLGLPSSLLVPLLFLRRAGTLPKWK